MENEDIECEIELDEDGIYSFSIDSKDEVKIDEDFNSEFEFDCDENLDKIEVFIYNDNNDKEFI